MKRYLVGLAAVVVLVATLTGCPQKQEQAAQAPAPPDKAFVPASDIEKSAYNTWPLPSGAMKNIPDGTSVPELKDALARMDAYAIVLRGDGAGMFFRYKEVPSQQWYPLTHWPHKVSVWTSKGKETAIVAACPNASTDGKQYNHLEFVGGHLDCVPADPGALNAAVYVPRTIDDFGLDCVPVEPAAERPANRTDLEKLEEQPDKAMRIKSADDSAGFQMPAEKFTRSLTIAGPAVSVAFRVAIGKKLQFPLGSKVTVYLPNGSFLKGYVSHYMDDLPGKKNGETVIGIQLEVPKKK